MTKIKVAHVVHAVGGVDVYLRLLAKNIDSSKFENIILHGNEDTDQAFLDGNKNALTEYKLPIFRKISIWNDLRAIVQAYKIIKKENPDFIHAHSAKGGAIGRIAAILTRKRCIYTPHAFSFLSSSGKIMRTVYLCIEKILSQGTTLLLACSESERERGIIQAGFKASRTAVFSNPIEPLDSSKSLDLNKKWPENYICTVGRPCYQKNIDFMIKVFNEVKKSTNTHLVLMGIGHHADELDKVLQLVNELNLNDHITLLKWAPRKDVLNIISKSKLYISTARYEGLPYSIIESMAASVPAVVSDCDGNRDLIKHGYNGYIVNEGDLETFSQRICELLGDDEKRLQFSKNCLTEFTDHYNILKKIGEIESYYTKLSY